ncbi:MAG: glycosyltransferase family 2 protein [Congregibacter sp.]
MGLSLVSQPSTPRVSTIVPVYNGMGTLQSTVDSLLAQEYPSHEIVLVDDGSADDSPELLRELAESVDITAVFKPNGGVGDARNCGVEAASGELIAFCDQDDTWEPDKLALQVPLFANPEIGLVFSGVRTVYPDREVIGLPVMKRPSLEDMLVDNRISCCTAVTRRSLFEAVGGFDADRVMAGVDDWHLWLRLLQRCEVDSVRKALATHVIHGDNYSLRESAMLDAALLCLSKLGSPAHQPPIAGPLLRDAERRVYEHYGQNLLHNGDFKLAANCFVNAWKKNPRRLSSFLKGLALYGAPNPLLANLQRRKREQSAARS